MNVPVSIVVNNKKIISAMKVQNSFRQNEYR